MRRGQKKWRCRFCYLERLPEPVAHDGVQQGVDACGQVVEDTGDVGDDHVGHGTAVVLGEGGHQTLGVEGQPADDEGDHHGH